MFRLTSAAPPTFDPALKMSAPIEFAVELRFLFFPPKGGLPSNHEIRLRVDLVSGSGLHCIGSGSLGLDWYGPGWSGLDWLGLDSFGRAGLYGTGLEFMGLD